MISIIFIHQLIMSMWNIIQQYNINIIITIASIVDMPKSKPIRKPQKSPGPAKPSHKHKSKAPKKLTNQQGDPLIKNLTDFVTSIKITHSDKPIYTGGRIQAGGKNIYATCNEEIVVYGIESRVLLDKIKHIHEEIVNFSVCHDQKYIVTFTQNSMIRVLHLQSKKILHTVKVTNSFANDIQFSPDNRYIAFAFGNTVHIYTFQTMKRTHMYNPTNGKFIITKIQWHPVAEKLQIVTCDLQRNIAVFDYLLNKVVAVSEAGAGGTDFCLSDSGDLLVSVNNQNIIISQTKTLTTRTTLTHQSYFESVLILDNQVYVGGQQTELHSFPLSTPGLSKIKQHPGYTDSGVAKIMATGAGAAGKKLLVLSVEQNVGVVGISRVGLEYQGMIVGYNDEIIEIKNSKTGDQECPYFLMVTNSNNLKLIHKPTQTPKLLIPGHKNIVLCADYWHPYIASGGKDNTLKLWRINDEDNTVTLLTNYNGHSGDILSLVALVVSGIIATVSEDGTIKLWRMVLEGVGVEVSSAIRTTVAHDKSINSIRASPKQDLLATCSQDRTIKIWNQHLTNIMTLVGHKRGVWDTAFHPVQSMIVSAGGDGMLKGWNLQTGECMWSMGEGPALIRCAWIYYNQVVTGSLNGIIKIWDIRKQTSLSYDKHEGKIWALDVTKKDNKCVIYSGATDSVYHVWTDNTQQMKENIMHQHELQQQERIFYDQHMADKKYCEGAIIAFKANYIKLFMNALEKISCRINSEQSVDFDNEGKLILKQTEQQLNEVNNQQFQQMCQKLKQIDLPRLLSNIQAMISTIKLYKIGNRLLLNVLKKTSINELVELSHKFYLPETVSNENVGQEYFNQKKSDFVKWLENMISYEQKHSSRLHKYVVGTHWVQHLYKIDNPFSY